MNVFEAVKQSVTTRQAAEHYGIRVNRNGMACCPFHNDKTPSMKLDKRFHCFGCGADGDVIDFVAALYGLGKKEAAAQLASDFGLAYEDWKPPGRARKPKPRQKSPEEQFREAKAHCFRVLADYLHLLRVWKTDYAPHSPEEAFHPRFVEALQQQAHVDYLLDVVLLKPVPRLKLPGLLGAYKKGAHLLENGTVTEMFKPYMTFFRTSSIDIEVLDGNPLITTLDGECSPQLRMHAELAHSAVRILLPPELAENANKTPVLQAMGE